MTDKHVFELYVREERSVASGRETSTWIVSISCSDIQFNGYATHKYFSCLPAEIEMVLRGNKRHVSGFTIEYHVDIKISEDTKAWLLKEISWKVLDKPKAIAAIRAAEDQAYVAPKPKVKKPSRQQKRRNQEEFGEDWTEQT
jgi:hypothetical protein